MPGSAKERVRAFPNEGLVESKGKLLCTFCNQEIHFERKSTVFNHCKSAAHKKNKASGTSQPIISTAFETQGERISTWSSMTSAFVSAGVPLNVFTHPALRTWINSHIKGGDSLPSVTTLRKYLVAEGETDLSTTKLLLKDKKAIIMVDETSDVKNRKVVNVLVSPSTPDSRFRLILTEIVEKCNAEKIVQLILKSTQLVGIDMKNVIAFISDNAQYMILAGKTLKGINSRILHSTCWAHVLHLIAEEVRGNFKLADEMIAKVKACLVKAESRRNYLIEKLEEHGHRPALPPVPVITRWNTWLAAGDYHFRHFNAIKDWIQASSSDSKAMENLKNLIDRPELYGELQNINLIFPSLELAIKSLEKTELPASDAYLILETIRGVLEQSSELESALQKLDQYMEAKHPSHTFWKEVEFFDPRKHHKFGYDIVLPGSVKHMMESEIPLSEMVAYKTISTSFQAASDFSPFKFWIQYAREMPLLSQVALMVLSIPASSADVERSFSQLNNLLQPNRSSLTPENLAIHLRLQFNSENCLDTFKNIDQNVIDCKDE